MILSSSQDVQMTIHPQIYSKFNGCSKAYGVIRFLSDGFEEFLVTNVSF
jgi:hypothetical protein